jgi:hypothetical protein
MFVGQGGSYHLIDDILPVTVVKIINLKLVIVTEDSYDLIFGLPTSFYPNSEGKEHKVSLRNDGIWREVNSDVGWFDFTNRRLVLKRI